MVTHNCTGMTIKTTQLMVIGKQGANSIARKDSRSYLLMHLHILSR